ncbi:MAG: hypothetical protein IPK03_05830 [Bacteroidetes bacterium]|nr:hypothetical protein [Bacteroidota bacterium]
MNTKILKFLKEYGTDKQIELHISLIDRFILFNLLPKDAPMINIVEKINELLSEGLIYKTNNSFFGLTQKGLDSIS